MDKKKLALLLGAKKKVWSMVFNGSNTFINAGSEASIDNLHDAAFTVEGYFNPDNYGESNAGYFFDKAMGGAAGWFVQFSSSNIRFAIFGATSHSIADYAFTVDNKFHHIAVTFDDAGDRKCRTWVDGVLRATATNAVVGAVVTDASNNLGIGARSDNANSFDGNIGWIRISNVVRYTNTFTPISRLVYPDVDANTVRLFKTNEGIGTTLIDYSTNAQNTSGGAFAWAKV